MKFGKSMLEELASPNFPEEWKKGAIEYKQLKKLINGVVAELESLGLNTQVLQQLLQPDEEYDEAEEEQDAEEPSSQIDESLAPPRPHTQRKPSDAAAEWVESIAEPVQVGQPSAEQLPSERKDADADDAVQHITSHVGSLSTSDDPFGRTSGIGKKDLKRLRESRSGNSSSSADDGDAEPEGGLGHESSSARIHDWGAHAWRERRGTDLWHGSEKDAPPEPPQQLGPTGLPLPRSPRSASRSPTRSARPPRRAGKWIEGKNGRRARAEYELGGTPERPIPRIRLHIESPETSDAEGLGNDEDDEGDARSVHADGLEETLGQDGLPVIQELPPTPEFKAMPPKEQESRLASGLPALEASAIPPTAPSLSSAASTSQTAPPAPHEQGAPSAHTKSSRKMRKREIVISLTADTEFLDTLSGALANLSEVQHAQRDVFVADVENLTNSIARASSPYASKNDLYVWREIFALWMEMQIFESERERDRGELSVDQSEERLKRFAEELAKRGWVTSAADIDAQTGKSSGRRLLKRKPDNSSTTTMRDPQSAKALEDFIKLNVALLDVKKFQRINVEAARKILKKHDKRTALTASDEFRAFIARQEGARAIAAMAADSVATLRPESATAAVPTSGALTTTHPSLAALLPSSTTGILSESLPHILLSLLSTTLLPILPSIDNFECGICYSVAWRPIRLDCSHLFCIRCLVKLQKQGKRDCPLCRAKDAVASADAKNLDAAATNMLKAWFPREVSEKDKENESDRKKEEMKELGLEEANCVII